MDEQHGVGAAVAEVAAGGQVLLLVGGEVGAAVGADQQPGRAAAVCRPLGLTREHRGALQRRVEPDGATGQACRSGQHRQQGQHHESAGPGAPPRDARW
jgi:hypothetical protein